MIDVFAKVKKIVPSAILLLVGEGDLRNVVEQNLISLGLINDVIFMGSVIMYLRLFQAMDVFLLPSHFEGITYCWSRGTSSWIACSFFLRQ